MSREIAVLVKDDFTKEPADETLFFGFERTSYRIDLTTANAGEFRALMRRYVAVAEEVLELEPDTRVSSLTGKREYNRAMREWAPAHGFEEPHKLAKGGYYYSRQLQEAFDAAVKSGEVTLG